MREEPYHHSVIHYFGPDGRRASKSTPGAIRRAMEEFRSRQRASRKSKVQPSQADRSKPGRKLKEPGERYDERALGRAIDQVCRREGIPLWHPNQLRHAHGTAVRARFGLEAAPRTARPGRSGPGRRHTAGPATPWPARGSSDLYLAGESAGGQRPAAFRCDSKAIVTSVVSDRRVCAARQSIAWRSAGSSQTCSGTPVRVGLGRLAPLSGFFFLVMSRIVRPPLHGCQSSAKPQHVLFSALTSTHAAKWEKSGKSVLTWNPHPSILPSVTQINRPDGETR